MKCCHLISSTQPFVSSRMTCIQIHTASCKLQSVCAAMLTGICHWNGHLVGCHTAVEAWPRSHVATMVVSPDLASTSLDIYNISVLEIMFGNHSNNNAQFQGPLASSVVRSACPPQDIVCHPELVIYCCCCLDECVQVCHVGLP